MLARIMLIFVDHDQGATNCHIPSNAVPAAKTPPEHSAIFCELDLPQFVHQLFLGIHSWRGTGSSCLLQLLCVMAKDSEIENHTHLFGIMGNVKSNHLILQHLPFFGFIIRNSTKSYPHFPNSSSAFFCASSTAFRSTRPTGSATTGTGASAAGGRAKWAAWTSHPISILQLSCCISLITLVSCIASVLIPSP